ncbi:MAG: hypothetical protein AAGJ28_05180, partial [Pseudomonadota bacterium]
PKSEGGNFMMKHITLMLTALSVAGCIGPKSGPAELKKVSIEQLSAERFSVSILSQNMDGYELTRCIAAAYTNEILDDDGNRLFSIYKRDGGKLTDEFRLSDGVRNQTTAGNQLYSFLKEGEHDGRDVMDVDIQLARCAELGLPTKVGEG